MIIKQVAFGEEQSRMIIENIDVLKVWLVRTLEPICDADPAALAKYVIALAKKDKPQPELQALCEDQLDVFLGDNTKEFVKQLFEALQSKSYLQDLVKPEDVAMKKEETKEEPQDEETKGTKRKSFEEGAKNDGDKVQKTADRPDVGGKAPENDKENVNEAQIEQEKEKEKEKEDAVDKEKPLRMSTRQTSKKDVDDAGVDDVSMRSISVDRSAKSLSPQTSRSTRHGHSSSRRRTSRSPKRSSRHTRSSRRKKSPSRREDRDDRNKESSSSSKSSSRRKEKEKEKCRDYEEKGFCMLGEVCPYDHGYDPVEVDDTNLPQMLSLAGLPPASQPNQPPHPTQLPMQRFPPNVVPPGAPPPPPPPPMLPAGMSGSLSLNTGLTTVQVQNARPIPSPAELPGHQVPIFRPRNPLAFMQRNISPPGVRPVAPQVVTPVAIQPAAKTADPMPNASNNSAAYNPEEPSIESNAAKTIKNAMKSHSSSRKDGERRSAADDDGHRKRSSATADEENRTQDELVAIAMGKVPLTPIVGSQPNMFQPSEKTNVVASVPLPVAAPLVVAPNPYQNRPEIVQPPLVPLQLTVQQQYHQLQLQQQQQAAVALAQQQQQLQQQQQQQQQLHHHHHQQPHHQQGPHGKPYRKNHILELQKIPAHLNNMVRLTEFFQKFGCITRIQTPHQNDVQSALIEFSQHQEAVAAYNCPDAILGNRFIKMYWHNPARQKMGGPLTAGGASVEHRSQNVPHQEGPHHHASHAGPGPRPPRSRPPPIDQLTYTNPKTDPKLMQMEKKNELNKLKIELLKKKQTHYEELTKKQKEIFSKLSKDTVTKEEKARLLKAFKAADAAAQKLKKELQEEARKKPVTLAAVPVQPVVRNLKEATKAILDKEIDIYHGNLNGEALLQAKKDLAKLKNQVISTWGSLDEEELTEARNVMATVKRDRREASHSSSMGGGPYNSRGRGGFRGRGRSSWYATGPRGGGRGGGARGGGALHFNNPLNIDKRPKEIIVSGYDLAQKDDVVKHFAKFGQLDRIEEHDSNSMKLTFPTRKAAETAAEQGASFQGTQLILSWFTAEAAAAHQRKEQQAAQQQATEQQQQPQQETGQQLIQQHVQQQPLLEGQQPPQPTEQPAGGTTAVTEKSLSTSLEDKDLDEEWLEMDKEEEEMLLADVEDDDDDDDAIENERSWRR